MAASKIPTFKLNNGFDIPVIGLGTENTSNFHLLEYVEIIKEAVKLGYRHFDTIEARDNNVQIAEALKSEPRDELFITSKIYLLEKDAVCEKCRTLLSYLNLEYVDLLLMNKLPEDVKQLNGSIPIEESTDFLNAWEGFEDCLEKGLAKSIGLVNFDIEELKTLLENCKIKPAVNQFETHPAAQKNELVEFCKSNKITVCAIYPLGKPSYFRHVCIPEFKSNERTSGMKEIISRIAKKYGKTKIQVMLKWAIQRGIVVIPEVMIEGQMIEFSDVRIQCFGTRSGKRLVRLVLGFQKAKAGFRKPGCHWRGITHNSLRTLRPWLNEEPHQTLSTPFIQLLG